LPEEFTVNEVLPQCCTVYVDKRRTGGRWKGEGVEQLGGILFSNSYTAYEK
jgi:hypothetical protein